MDCNNVDTRATDAAMGRKLDEGKLRLDLLPITPLEEVTKVLMFGAQKYAEWNWAKGIAFSRCYAAALRHMLAWWKGADKDDETGLSPIDHAICELMFLSELIRSRPDLDNRPCYYKHMRAEAQEQARSTADTEPKTTAENVFDTPLHILAARLRRAKPERAHEIADCMVEALAPHYPILRFIANCPVDENGETWQSCAICSNLTMRKICEAMQQPNIQYDFNFLDTDKEDTDDECSDSCGAVRDV